MSPLPVGPRRLQWLDEQLSSWRTDGIVSDEQAQAIRSRYETDTRNALTTLVLVLGALFVGIGLLWLIAANVEYDQLSPLARFLAIAFLSTAFTVSGMTVARLGAPLRVLGAVSFGGVIFQAAQSLQVPAYEPVLLLAWAAGAIALAYGAHSAGPLVIGVAAGLGWYVWALAEDAESISAFVLGLALATPVLAAVAIAHGDDRLGGPWRVIACLTALLALFIPVEQINLGFGVYAGVGVAALAIALSAWRSDRWGWLELGGAAAIAGACLLLVVTAPDSPGFLESDSSGAAVAHELTRSVLFLAGAVGVAAVGVAREIRGVINVAAFALVVFVTLQSFGVLASLFSGALLFLFMGVLLVAVGLLVDRGRRRLQREVVA